MKTILTLGTASLFTVNCPGGVRELYDFATKGKEVKEKAGVASVSGDVLQIDDTKGTDQRTNALLFLL